MLGGVSNSCRLMYEKFDIVLDKSEAVKGVESAVNLPEYISAPVEAGEVIGNIDYKIGDETIGSVNIVAVEAIEKISYLGLLKRMINSFFLK